MRTLLHLILLLSCFFEAGAKNLGALPQGRVSGHVVLADTRAPARNAVVLLTSLDGQNRQFLRVGLDGSYLFEHVVPGDYIVITYLDGYLSPFDKIARSLTDATIGALFEKIVAAQGTLKVGSQGTRTFDISLERGASVSGRVLYSDGMPAIQVGIELQDTAAPLSRRGAAYIQLGDIDGSEFIPQSLETDDQGRFRIAGVRPAVYRIGAVQLQKEPRQTPDRFVRSLFGALRFYTNDTIHPGSAKTYALAAGQDLTGLEIRIPLDGFHSVEGKVVAPDGRSITSAEVTITETSDPSLYFLSAVSEGSFRFDRLPPGTYTVTAQWGNIASEGKTTGAFGSGTTSFILKDTDLSGVRLTLPEAPGKKLYP